MNKILPGIFPTFYTKILRNISTYFFFKSNTKIFRFEAIRISLKIPRMYELEDFTEILVCNKKISFINFKYLIK